MNERSLIEHYIRNFSKQAPLFGQVFAADSPNEECSHPEWRKAIDAFAAIQFGCEGEVTPYGTRIEMNLSLTELAKTVGSPSTHISKFLFNLKTEIEIQVGKGALLHGPRSTAKSRAELYGDWLAIAILENGETRMKFIGEWEVGFVSAPLG